MKKFSALLLIAACVFSVACSGEKRLGCTVQELMDKICTVNAEGEMFSNDEDSLSDDWGIEKALYTEGLFMIPKESAGVETVAFFVAKDAESAKTIKAALDRFVKFTQVEQKDYNADNYQVSLDAVTVAEGVYAYLVMSPAKDAIMKVIEDNLK